MLTADFVYLNLWKWTMTISTGRTVRGSGVHKMQFKGIHGCWLVDTVCQCANILWAEKLIKALCLICAWRAVGEHTYQARHMGVMKMSFLELTEAQRCRMMNRRSAEASEWHYF